MPARYYVGGNHKVYERPAGLLRGRRVMRRDGEQVSASQLYMIITSPQATPHRLGRGEDLRALARWVMNGGLE